MHPLRLACLYLLLTLASLVGVGAGAVRAQDAPGSEPERISRASDLDPGSGAVIISVRSELYLLSELSLYFLREGGEIGTRDDVVRLSRAQSQFSPRNSTAKYQPFAVQLPAGRYRLVGHGARCLKVPLPDERCVVDVKFAGIGETVSFPSRGYGPDAPVIEVQEGTLTHAGDFALTAQNNVEWSPIPSDKLRKVEHRLQDLPRGPEPVVADNFKLKYPLRARSFSDDRGRRY